MLKQEKEDLAVYYSYARTGGTLLNRCLGAVEDNLVLSEANPRASSASLSSMAEQWFGIDSVDESQPFSKVIKDIKGLANLKGKNLVVRDWSHVDFVGFPWFAPTYKSSTREDLAINFDLHEIAIVRHPFDVFKSINEKTAVRGLLTMNSFLKGYDAYTKLAKEVGFVKYEDLCFDPESTVRMVCETLKIDFQEDFLDKWTETPVVGDVEGNDKTKIRRVTYPRPKIGIPTYQRILERLGYDD